MELTPWNHGKDIKNPWIRGTNNLELLQLFGQTHIQGGEKDGRLA